MENKNRQIMVNLQLYSIINFISYEIVFSMEGKHIILNGSGLRTSPYFQRLRISHDTFDHNTIPQLIVTAGL